MRKKILSFSLIIVIALAFCSTLARDGVTLESLIGMGTGSEKYRDEWVGKLGRYDDISRLKALYLEDLQNIEFLDRTWICGVCLSSHGHYDGGTIVIRDDKGRFLYWMGHVCAPSALADMFRQYKKSSEIHTAGQIMDELRATYKEIQVKDIEKEIRSQ